MVYKLLKAVESMIQKYMSYMYNGLPWIWGSKIHHGSNDEYTLWEWFDGE